MDVREVNYSGRSKTEQDQVLTTRVAGAFHHASRRQPKNGELIFACASTSRQKNKQ
jgi:hypothetical protein